MFKKINNITYLKNEPLSNYSSFKIGGKTKYLILAHTIDSLLDCIEVCTKHNIKYKIIGNGSNLLFDDMGYNGAIIKYINTDKKIIDNLLYASAGNNFSELINYTLCHNLSGIEFGVGVPAQLGGALVNNLGAYNHSIGNLVKYVTVLRDNHIIYLNNTDCQFQYHSSTFQTNSDIILATILNLSPSTRETIICNTQHFFNIRTSSQPLNLPNCGSIFKRQNDIIPAKLIDDLGLKGLNVGGAQISTKHSGFIVNLGNAKSQDVLQLINMIKDKVYQNYKINLIPEIEYLPF